MSDPTPAPDALPASLLARIHLYMALQPLTLPWDQAEAQLLGWLDALPDAGHGDGVRLQAAVCVEQQSLRWQADGPVALFIQPVAQYFQRRSAAPDQQALLATAGPLLRPDRLGCWLEVVQEQAQLGWVLPASRRLADLVGWAPEPKYAAPLMEWASQHGVVEASALGRSLDEAAPLAELTLMAPGADGAARVEAIAGLARALRLVAPGAVDTLAAAPGLVLVVRLGKHGAEDLGVRVPHPGPEGVRALCVASGQQLGPDLPAFQRAIGASGPDFAELRLSWDRQRVELVYSPGRDPEPEQHEEAVRKARELMVMDN